MGEVAQAIANARNECDLGPSDAPSDVINNLVGYVRAFRELWIQSNGELSSAQFNYASEVGIQLGLRMRLEEFLGESFEALGDAVESAISALEKREKLREAMASAFILVKFARDSHDEQAWRAAVADAANLIATALQPMPEEPK